MELYFCLITEITKTHTEMWSNWWTRPVWSSHLSTCTFPMIYKINNTLAPTRCTIFQYTSAKYISVWADWLRQSRHAPSEPSETPRWRITTRLVSIPRVDLHITLRLPFRSFFSLCRSLILNEHSGVVSNCDHTSEWVHCVHTYIRIAMHKDPRNCADPWNHAQSKWDQMLGKIECVFSLYDKMRW
jgi:hypothetical protein